MKAKKTTEGLHRYSGHYWAEQAPEKMTARLIQVRSRTEKVRAEKGQELTSRQLGPAGEHQATKAVSGAPYTRLKKVAYRTAIGQYVTQRPGDHSNFCAT